MKISKLMQELENYKKDLGDEKNDSKKIRRIN